MRRMDVADLRARFDEMLDLVRSGESIEITHESVPVARLAPVENPLERIDDAVIAKPRARLDEALPLSEPIPCTADIVRVLLEERDSR